MFDRIREKRERAHQKHARKAIILKLQQAVESASLNDVIEIVASHGNEPEVMNAALHDSKSKNGADRHGPTALIQAARSNHPEIVSALLKAPCIDLNAVDDLPQVNKDEDFEHNTPLLAAALNRRVENVKVLAAMPGSNVNAQGVTGRSVLMCAVYYSPSAISTLLQRTDIDINAVDFKKRSALHHACIRSSVYSLSLPRYIYELAFAPGIHINAADMDGWTPLMFAARQGNEAIVIVLLQQGANSRLRNHAACTAADIASSSGHRQIAGLLEKHAKKPDLPAKPDKNLKPRRHRSALFEDEQPGGATDQSQALPPSLRRHSSEI